MPIGPSERTDRQTLTPEGSQGNLDSLPNAAADRREEREEAREADPNIPGRAQQRIEGDEDPQVNRTSRHAIQNSLDDRVTDLEGDAPNFTFDTNVSGGQEFYPWRGSFQTPRNLTLCVTGISGAVVTISAGNVIHGTTKIAVAQKNVTVNGGTDANPHYIYIEYAWGGSASVQNPATASFPLPNQTDFQIPLFAFKRVGPVAVLVASHHPGGDIIIPSAFA